MGTNKSTVSTLYLNSCQLAYTESQMGISPRLPFGVSDSDALGEQALTVANAAKRLRSLDPTTLAQEKVDAASKSVKTVQTMFDFINTQTSNNLLKKEVFSAVVDAITDMDAID